MKLSMIKAMPQFVTIENFTRKHQGVYILSYANLVLTGNQRRIYRVLL